MGEKFIRTYFPGIMKSYHTNLFMDGMMKFSQIDGNMNAGCPKATGTTNVDIFRRSKYII